MGGLCCIYIPGLEPTETYWNRIPGVRGSDGESRNLIFNKNLGDFYDQANLESSNGIHASIYPPISSSLKWG